MRRTPCVLVCFLLLAAVTPARAATVVYNLYATDGYIEMADGLPVYIYGVVGGREGVDLWYQTSYCVGDGVTRNCSTPTTVAVPGGPVAPLPGPWTGQDAQFAGNAQYPAPIIYAKVGDTITIRFKNLGVAANPNAPDEARSLYFQGFDMPPDGGVADPGEVLEYTLTPTRAGTFVYSSYERFDTSYDPPDADLSMGMFGVLVVYNPEDPAAVKGPGMGFGGALYGVPYDRDYVLLLSEIDVRAHADEVGTYVPGGLLPPNSWDPDPFNWALYGPHYWLINGLSYPQTLHNGFPSGYTFADWMVAHPGYDPLIVGSASVPSPAWGTPGEKVLLRVVNAGFQTHAMHVRGFHGKVIGSDQRAWDWGFAPDSKTNKKGSRPFGEGLEKSTLTLGPGEIFEWLIDVGQQSSAAGQFLPLHNGDRTRMTNDGVYPGGMYTAVYPTP